MRRTSPAADDGTAVRYESSTTAWALARIEAVPAPEIRGQRASVRASWMPVHAGSVAAQMAAREMAARVR